MRAPDVAAGEARGRPRDARIDDAILAATLRLLDEQGYQRMSIASVAAAAGVGRPALYRRFGSKAELVVAAIQQMTSGPEPVLPRDSRAALRALLTAAGGAFASPGAIAVLGSLLAEQRRDPALLAAFRARIFDPHRAAVHRVLELGVASGEVALEADREAIDSLLFGGLLARATLGEPVDVDWIDRTLDQAWRGVARQPTTETVA
ncbi:MAG: TetR/AcrR family transcriptional regulator [Chloroflexi bacterium]|nr:TetR/AcrR family transcriptional regulator [Chloroflexota bacterium]